VNLGKKWVLVKKSGFLATFKTGFDHKKVSVYAGSRGVCPLSHFISTLNSNKNKNI
jgi:hypothetical protein